MRDRESWVQKHAHLLWGLVGQSPNLPTQRALCLTDAAAQPARWSRKRQRRYDHMKCTKPSPLRVRSPLLWLFPLAP